jgi:amino acid transporter
VPDPDPESNLRRELGLRDVTLFAITCIVGMRWISSAAHAGPGSILLWVLGAVFFVVPIAATVGALVVKYPGAGGLYIWTRKDFGPWHGFLCFWIYWMSIAIWYPSAAIFYMGAALHAVGAPETRLWLLAAALVAIWVALGTNLVGMKIGKWTENLGGAAAWTLSAVFVLIAAIVWMRRGSATHLDILPHWSWDTVNLWATVAYAMTGLELAGMMGAEIRDPDRTLPRAGWIASICITLFYATTTAALLVLLRPDQISDMTGLAQTGDQAARVLGLRWIAPFIALLVMASGMGQLGGLGTGASRLPFAVAADGLLPAAFARVHPRWGTPHLSILVMAGVATVLLIAYQIGDTLRAAYQTLVSMMVIAGFLPFLYIFGSGWKAGKRISAISGWAITAMALFCAVVPTGEITNVWLFEGKLGLGTAAVVGSAWLMYRIRASATAAS